ncbi:hypothetical protein FHX42_004591 [Saccharopolyspora lacisalsi]|uniref:Uncharacterized protein n=1 Tax=Halosaccharopolyspora lacisalsi TaxID=1000566 RepID=A0A839E665_9PSEU|nr:hypothetical protein [Halosaccharopolyspora lacisalsi]MBA8827207.1 hypothetical protein [Halosaccharopolyspora lacisalsi]
MALGRTKIGRRQRAESLEDQQESEPDREIESYLAALTPEEEDTETTGSGRRFGAAQVYQLRLPLMANERLKELAARQGTSPDALARDWVMQHLSDAEAAEAEPDPGWPQEEPRTSAHARRGPTRQGPPQQFPEAPGTPYPDQYSEPYPAAGSTAQAPWPPPGYTPRASEVEETDTEITIPHGQRRYY